MAEIPGLLFTIRQALDRLQYQHGIYNEEFIQRLKLVMGHPDFITTPGYGIIAQDDPASAISGGNEPLTVSVNAGNNFQIDVSPGLVVTPSAVWVQIGAVVSAIELADPAVGAVNVVYLRYTIEPANTELNDYQEPVIPYTMRPGTAAFGSIAGSQFTDGNEVYVDTLDSYFNYLPSIQEDFVPIAIVTVQQTVDPGTGNTVTSLSIDHTRNSYPFNRPWFSAKDIEHRGQVGTGEQTSTNPHAISQNDLTVGDFTPFQLQLDHGMIVADDKAFPKQPGYRCLAEIPYSSVKTDDGSIPGTVPGTITGFPNKKYIELENYPVRLGRVWIEENNFDVATLTVPETNIIVFPADDPPVGKPVNIYYNRVDACAPPIGQGITEYQTSNPVEEELIIAGGVGHTALASTVETFGDAQKFPMLYNILVDGEGNLIKTPQVVYCYKKLTLVSTSDVFNIDLYGPGRLAMGLAEASGAAGMSIKVRVYGKNEDGNDTDFLFEFTDTSWGDPGPIPRDTLQSNAYVASSQIFSEITELVVEENLNSGPNSSIMIWSMQNPQDTYDLLKDACITAELMWDGLRIAHMRDKRIIETTVRDQRGADFGVHGLYYTALTLAGGSSTLYVEDYSRPIYTDQRSLVERENSTSIPLYQLLGPHTLGKLSMGYTGQYQTRALPVQAGSSTTWRCIKFPAFPSNRKDIYLNPSERPVLYWYDGIGWNSVLMSAVAGMFNTFETTIFTLPTMVMLQTTETENMGFALFG